MTKPMTLDEIHNEVIRAIELWTCGSAAARLEILDLVEAYAAEQVAAALFPCVVNPFLSCVCACGTKGCNVAHDWVKTQADVDEQVAEYRQDAERYRWLRDPCSPVHLAYYPRGDYGKGLFTGPALDEKIDAAIRARGAQEATGKDSLPVPE